MKKYAIFIVLCFIIFLGCSSVQVSQDYEPSADFSNLKNYKWQSSEQEKTGDIRVDNPLLDKRIREAVDQSLSEKGYQIGNQTSYDFYVLYKMTIKRRIDSDNISTGVGFGIGSSGSFGGIGINTGGRVNEYDEALIIIDIISAEDNKLLWRGKSTSRMSQHSTPEKTTESVNRIIEKIMAQFPPE
jgi:hypothetical protein